MVNMLNSLKLKDLKNHEYWHSDARAWLEETGISAPLYWHKIDGKWHYYTLAGLKPINKDAPLMHISFYEAYAFAEWKGLRLPTEFEWETAANLFRLGQEVGTYSQCLPPPIRDIKKPGRRHW